MSIVLRKERQNLVRRPPTATITDVARLAGVGTMTVSRVLNGASHVGPETAERVQQAIRTTSRNLIQGLNLNLVSMGADLKAAKLRAATFHICSRLLNQ
jgi:plasmid maintenance system antidote protein VapI